MLGLDTDGMLSMLTVQLNEPFGAPATDDGGSVRTVLLKAVVRFT
jgi:hypothetical protein